MGRRNRQHRWGYKLALRTRRFQESLSLMAYINEYAEPEFSAECRATLKALHPQAKPFNQAKADAQSQASSRRKPNTRGLVNLKLGAICYAREGWGWVKGKQVKIDPKATGITHRYGSSRADERAQGHMLKVQARAHRKAGNHAR